MWHFIFYPMWLETMEIMCQLYFNKAEKYNINIKHQKVRYVIHSWWECKFVLLLEDNLAVVCQNSVNAYPLIKNFFLVRMYTTRTFGQMHQVMCEGAFCHTVSMKTNNRKPPKY